MVAQAALVLPSDCMAADRIKCAVALRRLTYFGKDARMDRGQEKKLCNMLREIGHPRFTRSV